MTTTLELNLADILERKYPHGFHAPADIDISTFLEFADDDWSHTVDIDQMLSESLMIGIVRDTQLVLNERPDLSEDQAWEVLQACRPAFEEVTDAIRQAIHRTACERFPMASAKSAMQERLDALKQQIAALPDGNEANPALCGAIAARLDDLETTMKGANQ